ncbi:MAG: preprotein translocase subunit YajC [Fibrobacteraceae bacterium]|nr:preprotein translocase subunit YajC [Fibrobacteraceae bacterium]
MKSTALIALLFAASAFADGAAEPAKQGGSAIMGFLPFILMFVVMYLFFIMPKQKEMKKTEAMRKALKKGDKVLTSAGIIGAVADIQDNIITVKTGNDTKLDFEKSAILRVLEDKPATEKAAK